MRRFQKLSIALVIACLGFAYAMARDNENADTPNLKPSASETGSVAKEAAATETKSENATSAKKGTKASAESTAADFRKKFEAWRAQLQAIDALRLKYQIATDAEKQQLTLELDTKLAKAKAAIPAVIASAEKAFLAAPNEDKEITEFLLRIAGHYVTIYEYKKALDLVEIMQKAGVERDMLSIIGTLSAFPLNDYETAKRQFAKARESKFIAKNPKDMGDPYEKGMLRGLNKYASVQTIYPELWKQEQAIRRAEAKADDLPRVKLTTSKGTIVLELFENEAPNTVKSFVHLVESGFYNGLTFHRVIPFFMAQGGCPKGNGNGGPGYTIPCECYKTNARNHFAGTLSMAHAGKDTGGSQFFITSFPTPGLNGKHTVFGRVIEGFEVLGRLQVRIPDDLPPGAKLPPPDKILKAEVIRKRPGTDYSKFKKLETPE